MYRDLGFLRVAGRARAGRRAARPEPGYAYLVYPHKPIVAFVPETGRLLSEYCVEFPDLHGGGQTRLPASDDVLAKWMALTSDETPRDRRGQHAPRRPPARPLAASAATCGACRSGSAAAAPPRLHRGPRRVSTDPRGRSRVLLEGPDRAAARSYLKGAGYDDEALRARSSASPTPGPR